MTSTDRLYEAYLRHRNIATDSRKAGEGCIFFALTGERFDGNKFVPMALEQGAALCVTSDKAFSGNGRCLVVDDVLLALQELARTHRGHLAIPVVGITGTNGKTTTKELTHAVLSQRYRTACTSGNFNNHIGVPLTLLSIDEKAEMAIVEMGANHPHEIEALCSIADPDCGLITNVGRAHLEGFGSFEGVVRTKTELYRHLAKKHGQLFVNADNERLMREAASLAEGTVAIATYGSGSKAMVRGTLMPATGGDSPYMQFYFEVADNVYTVRTHLLGDYNFDNCMAAVAVGLHFGVEPFDIKNAIESYIPQNQRSEYRLSRRGNRLYLDCYNANPSSMAAAIASFRHLGGTMAIIGGMRELGAESREEHRRLVEMLQECRLERCLLVGAEFEGIETGPGMSRVGTTEEAAGILRAMPPSNATILVKGSNSNHLWELEDLL